MEHSGWSWLWSSNIYIYIYILSKVGNLSWGWPNAPFQELLHRGVEEGATPFPVLLHFTLDSYLIMLNIEQGGIKYHFLSFWHDSTLNWTQVSRTIVTLLIRLMARLKRLYVYLIIYIYIWSRRPGFNSRSGHIKDFKNGIWYLFA